VGGGGVWGLFFCFFFLSTTPPPTPPPPPPFFYFYFFFSPPPTAPPPPPLFFFFFFPRPPPTTPPPVVPPCNGNGVVCAELSTAILPLRSWRRTYRSPDRRSAQHVIVQKKQNFFVFSQLPHPRSYSYPLIDGGPVPLWLPDGLLRVGAIRGPPRR